MHLSCVKCLPIIALAMWSVIVMSSIIVLVCVDKKIFRAFARIIKAYEYEVNK